MNDIPNGIGLPSDAQVGKVQSDVTPDPRHAVIAQKKREIAEAEQAREVKDTSETVEEIVEIARRATGMNAEEFGAVVNQAGQVIGRTTGYFEPPGRDTVAARGVPELHLRSVYDQEPIDCDALEAVRGFISGSQTLLVISGGVGTRKSGSACWALCRRAGRYVTADDLSRLAAAKDDEGVIEYRKTKKAPFLVVDDLGGEYLDEKGWFVRALNALIDHRYSACLKTVITTNLDAVAFKKNYGERIADRVRESGRFLEVAGSSVRSKR